MRFRCADCRHANQGSMDYQDGLIACPWLGGDRRGRFCEIRLKDTGAIVFEPFDGTNGTWGSSASPYRSIPKGYEGRAVHRLPG